MAKKRYMPEVVNKVLITGIHWESQEYKGNNHKGEDIIQRNQEKYLGICDICSIEKGKVIATGFDKKMGNYVKIEHELGVSVYMHLKANSIKVKKGQYISKAQIIGTMGNTGNSNGPHLHLGIFIKGKHVDPYPYLIGEKSLIKSNEWTPGTYRMLYDKYIRTSPKVAVNKITYKTLIPEWKELTHPDKLGKARFNVGAEREIVEFITDSKGFIWGRFKTNKTPIWACLQDNTGNQAVKV